jgi:hypothetical protein
LTTKASDATTAAVLNRFVDPKRWAQVGALALGALLLLGAPGVARSAHAQALDGGDGEEYSAPAAERRDGFMASLQVDYGFLGVEGYPNKLGQIGDPAYRSYVGGVGGNLQLVLGGAIRDWLTAGLLVRAASVAGEGDVIGTATAIGLQLQGFPLWSYGGFGRNLGVTGEFGVGLGSIVDATDKDDLDILAEGGGMSHLGVGASYEVWKFWLFSAGPVVNYSYQFSQSLSSHMATVGMKLTFYSSQPR